VRTLLVANRGEIARRVARTARRMGLRVAAIYTEADRHALHVTDADVAIPVGSYLDADAVVAACHAVAADAVHPGYGFLAERADAARAVTAAGVTWVGPPPDVIAALGDKVRAKELMAAAGVPLLESMPTTAGADVTFPVLVKAAAGGGGRGMRLVARPDELDGAVEAASREALAAFGDGTVFLERWLPSPRHVEVQVVADAHGNVIHLGDRECSVQRRHQKVVEEAPSPSVPDGLRRRMTDAAVAGAAAVGYVGAGTWEFLVDGDEFYFLEVNTRLQVEHPVTEEVTGLDLVRLQLQIAGGEALSIRQSDVHWSGHAIEARVVAEDPTAGWLPSTGELERFEPTVPGVRYELGVGSGSVVGAEYDSLLGKVIAHAGTREEASARLATALEGLETQGVATNRELLVRLLREPDFRAGRTTTRYLEDHPQLAADEPAVPLLVAAAALWAQADRRRSAKVLATIPSGFRNLRSQDQVTAWRVGGRELTVSYTVDQARFRATVEDRRLEGRIVAIGPTGVDLECDGLRRNCRVHGGRRSVLVVCDGAQVDCIPLPRFVAPGAAGAGGRGPSAPVPGTVVKVEVAAGDEVVAGQTLVVLEAMKLEHRICAEVDGTVAAVTVSVGDRVDAHQLLVEML
jgi:acyl-CoA carboxylase subunit alpha